MEIDCPSCHKTLPVEGEDLPSDCCDSEEFTCRYCEHEFLIGWTAEVEVR